VLPGLAEKDTKFSQVASVGEGKMENIVITMG
jgi:hypothetical protein